MSKPNISDESELTIARKGLAFQIEEKEKLAAELIIARKELAFQKEEKGKRAAELGIANKELVFQDEEKGKRADELFIANRELVFQDDEKEKRAAELIIANKELIFQNEEKEKRAAELIIANKELAFQNEEKDKRAAELIIANKELVFQNEEKEKRAAELFIANKELVFQTGEKEKRAAELVIADIELDFQNKEKEKREIANKELEALSYSAKLASQYSLSLIEASRDPLFTISPEGKITDMNNASVKITDLSRERLIGTDFFNYFTEPDKAREGYQQVFAKGFVADYPLTIRDGMLTDVLFNGSVYKDDRGNVLGAVVVARVITEQKRIEKELTEAKVFAELATGIAEEAKSKAESATRIAEDAVKAKQQFLSNMSHEIRTPMNAIIGFTKVLLKTDLSAKQKEYLTAIKMSGDTLIVLINDILDLAKVDAGKMTFEQTAFKMEHSISAMLHLFETKIMEKNLLLIKEYDDKIPEVLVGDPVRLHQIILNLVSNAVKFTVKGEITVRVSLLSEDDEKANIEFAVSDTGIGISENKIENIFENFEQASSGTSRLYGGTGLGLAIVKQLVKAQGGNIVVKSKIDEGSTFSFILSFQKTKAEAELEMGIEEIDTEIKNIKVLVVEDMALNQLLMKTLLDDFGFERDIASNGKIAIEKLESKSYDIILMDLQMPEMNGFEATEYIRNKMNSKIPIIALTADVTTVDLAKCKTAGMNDYIAKPVDERLLYNKIVGLVKKPIPVKYNVNEVNRSAQSKKMKCINLSYLIRRTKSNPALMMEMISLYLEQTPPLIAAMKQSLKDKDWILLQAAVHKMIPSFSIMGISPDFENMAKQVKDYANTQQQSDGILYLVLQLENICEQACLELKEEFNTIKNAANAN
jgi:PAS domain S-box-containing protein